MVATKATKHKQLMEAGGVSKLHLAVFQGKQDKARKLLEKGCPDVNRGDKFGQTPLHIACHREGLLGCLKLLATHQANLKALDANGNTALHSAAGSGAAAAAEFLLGRGLSVAATNKDGHTPMDICNLHCPPDKQKAMRILLEGGTKVEEDRAGGGGSTAAGIATAVSPSDKSTGGYHPDTTATTYRAPSFEGKVGRTISSGSETAPQANPRSDVVSEVIAAGHDAGAGAMTAFPAPRTRAAFGGAGSRAVEAMAAAEAAPASWSFEKEGVSGGGGNITTNLTPSPTPSRATEGKHSSREATMSTLYQVGGSSSGIGSVSGSSVRDSLSHHRPGPAGAQNPNGAFGSSGGGGGGRSEEPKHNTSLVFTPRRGSAKMAALSRDVALTPGSVASTAGHAIGSVQATPTNNRRNTKKATLQELHLAIFQGDTVKVEEVVARGDVDALNKADRHGQTPLHLACYKGSRVMTRLLVEGGANLNAVDVNGNGVVHAAVCDSPAVLAILIDHGADVTIANFDGVTPMRLCEQYCPPRLRERMLQLLKYAALAQAEDSARKQQLAEEQVNIEAVYHQLSMLRCKLAATAAANTHVPASAAAEGAQTENALLTLVEANVRVVEGQRHALENMEKTAARLERIFRRLHMRFDSVSPGDVSFS